MHHLHILYKRDFHILKFLAVFALLSFIFYVLIGVSVPGGKFYFPVLHNYFDIVSWFTSFLAHGAGWLLNVLGYSVKYVYPSKLSISSRGGGVSIGYSCMGVQVMAFWAAFVIAHSVQVGYKLKWIAGGLAAIILLNMLRIALIALANYNHYITVLPLDHHTLFNICAYIIVFVLLVYFIRANNNMKEGR